MTLHANVTLNRMVPVLQCMTQLKTQNTEHGSHKLGFDRPIIRIIIIVTIIRIIIVIIIIIVIVIIIIIIIMVVMIIIVIIIIFIII